MSILVVGEFLSKGDNEEGYPFSDYAAKLLLGMFKDVGIAKEDCHFTNVLNLYPPSGDVKNLCGSKVDGISGLPAIIKGKFLSFEYASHIKRLFAEIAAIKPTMILSLGSISAAVLFHAKSLKAVRGTTLPITVAGSTYKVFPTYAPSTIFRDWTLRPILFADLQKAQRESLFPEVKRPSRKIWTAPIIDDLLRFQKDHIEPSSQLSIDIETAGTQITCIGFAPTKEIALVVPFTKSTGNGSYWESVYDERIAMHWCKRMCALPKSIIGQNILYDVHHLWRNYGIPLPNVEHDTMLLHHALQPEMQKGLGFLGSIYTDEASWKFMRHVETIKRED